MTASAADLAATHGSQPRRTSQDVQDAADRAFSKRKHGTERVLVKKIGFWPGNRGGLGINPAHVHGVAEDIMKNKCRRARYEPVELVEVPDHLREEFKRVNQARCDNDPLLPNFCADVFEYVVDHTLSKPKLSEVLQAK